MTSRKVSIAGCLALALLAVTIITNKGAIAQQSEPVENERFKDKIVSVFFGDPFEGIGQVIKDARLERIGGRWILIGTCVDSGKPDEWDEGLTSGIAWDSVSTYYVFTPAQFEETLKRGRSRRKDG